MCFASFSPDGQRVHTICPENTATIWTLYDSPISPEPIKHSEKIMSARFSLDGRRVVTASREASEEFAGPATLMQTGPGGCWVSDLQREASEAKTNLERSPSAAREHIERKEWENPLASV